MIDGVMENSNNCMQPSNNLYIDESLVKFIGRLSFKQYILNKKDRFGNKEFKLCVPYYYTIALKTYAGKESNISHSVGIKIVLKLSNP